MDSIWLKTSEKPHYDDDYFQKNVTRSGVMITFIWE